MTAPMDRRAEVCRALGAHVLRLREEMDQVIQRLHAVEQGEESPDCPVCGAGMDVGAASIQVAARGACRCAVVCHYCGACGCAA